MISIVSAGSRRLQARAKGTRSPAIDTDRSPSKITPFRPPLCLSAAKVDIHILTLIAMQRQRSGSGASGASDLSGQSSSTQEERYNAAMDDLTENHESAYWKYLTDKYSENVAKADDIWQNSDTTYKKLPLRDSQGQPDGIQMSLTSRPPLRSLPPASPRTRRRASLTAILGESRMCLLKSSLRRRRGSRPLQRGRNWCGFPGPGTVWYVHYTTVQYSTCVLFAFTFLALGCMRRV